MNPELVSLSFLTTGIALVHTLSGPDHYLPFIVLARSRSWSLLTTLLITLVCGLGHVFSSLVLGSLGLFAGLGLDRIEALESIRGDLAGWLFMVFGLGYLIWSLFQLKRGRSHKHFETGENEGDLFVYEHRHTPGFVVRPDQKFRVTPWVLFLIFVLGPCEPLLPLLSHPAARATPFGLYTTVSLFTLFTLLPMLGMVLAGYFGFQLLPNRILERHMNWVAGFVVFLSGFGMVVLGW